MFSGGGGGGGGILESACLSVCPSFAGSVVMWTWEQEVADSIPALASILSEDWW